MREEKEKPTGKAASETPREQGPQKNPRSEEGKESGSVFRSAYKKEAKHGVSAEKSTDTDSPQKSGGDSESDGTSDNAAIKRTNRKKALLISAFLLLVLIVSSGGMLLWFKGESPGSAKSKGLPVYHGPEFKLKPFFIPISLNEAEPEKLVKMTLVLELCSKEAARIISKQSREVRNAIFGILMKASPDEVQWEREVLTAEIISTVNLIFKNQIVKRVIFQDVTMI